MNLPPSLQLSQADRESMTSLLIEWANINSGSENLEGLNRMLSTLEKEFCRLPAEMKRLSLPSVRRTDSSGNEVAQLLGEALHLKCRPTAPLQILFSGHMDTVYSQHHAFQRCEIRGSQLHGPGVADMKGGLVVLLKSLEMFEKSPFHDQIGWEILISSDEEIGSPGSAPFLKEAADRHHLGLVFEASLPNGNLVKNRKGSGHFKIKVEGKSAHVGRDFSQGRNAIVALADFTLRIHQLNGEFAGTILNVGKINGGTALNVVPHHAEAQLNIRVDRFEEIANIQNRIHTIIQSIESLHEVQVQWSGSFNRPPKEITPEIETLFEEYQKCAQQRGVTLDWESTGGCCDGNNLAAAGLPNLDTLGVRGNYIHSDREFMWIESLAERTDILLLFLTKLATHHIAFPMKLSMAKIPAPTDC